MKITRKPAGLVLVAALACAGPAAGQKQAAPPPLHFRGMEVRNPEDMMRLPIRLHGIEEDGRTFRDSTPPLSRGKTRPSTVDVEQAYRRVRAIYEEGSFLTEPLREAGPAPAEPPYDPQEKPRNPDIESSALLWKLLILLAVFMSLLGAFICWNMLTRRPEGPEAGT